MPETLFTFVESQSKLSNFGSVSEYIRDLIRADQRRLAQARAERMDRDIRYNTMKRDLQYR